MTQRKGQGNAQGEDQAEPDERDLRAERLAAALKQNLKRRKAQARGRVADAAVPAEAERAPDERDR
jgi:hypothetical protein